MVSTRREMAHLDVTIETGRFEGHDESSQASSATQAGLNASERHIVTVDRPSVTLILTYKQYLGSFKLSY